MTDLQRRALASIPMTEAEVETAYKRFGTLPLPSAQRICESHERLRAECQGSEILIEEDRKRIEELEEVLRRLLYEVTVCIPGKVADPIIRRIEAALKLRATLP